jgi:hypothetical protein
MTEPTLHDRLRGFVAGVASGVTKLVVGHPFGKATTPNYKIS